MTAPARDPYAPRLLTLEQAAAYLNVPMAEVRRKGVGMVRFGSRVRYDRAALDGWLDAQRGVAPESSALDDDSPEAALERFTRNSPHAAGRA